MDEKDRKKLGEGVPFHRLRRITGYLVGDVSRMNDAKRTEVSQRVKHGVGSQMESLKP